MFVLPPRCSVAVCGVTTVTALICVGVFVKQGNIDATVSLVHENGKMNPIFRFSWRACSRWPSPSQNEARHGTSSVRLFCTAVSSHVKFLLSHKLKKCCTIS
jgi:hypothetical protein